MVKKSPEAAKCTWQSTEEISYSAEAISSALGTL